MSSEDRANTPHIPRGYGKRVFNREGAAALNALRKNKRGNGSYSARFLLRKALEDSIMKNFDEFANIPIERPGEEPITLGEALRKAAVEIATKGGEAARTQLITQYLKHSFAIPQAERNVKVVVGNPVLEQALNVEEKARIAREAAKLE